MSGRGTAGPNLQDPAFGALDNPIWSALTSAQAAIAFGGPHARRLPADIGPFAAIIDHEPASLIALAALVERFGTAALFTAAPLPPIPALKLLSTGTLDQMVATTPLNPHPGIVPLTHADAAEMQDLAARAKPGPFGPRTHELGQFYGIRIDGQLAAMAGERLRPTGCTEITAVCTSPAHRGKGYAQILVEHTASAIQSRGETAFLHVFTNNPAAIAVYRRANFQTRRQLHLTILGH